VEEVRDAEKDRVMHRMALELLLNYKECSSRPTVPLAGTGPRGKAGRVLSLLALQLHRRRRCFGPGS
jgi:hypothetical protein